MARRAKAMSSCADSVTWGSAVGEALGTFKIPFLVVETDPDAIRGLPDRGIPSLSGDAQQERILEHAGLSRAVVLIVTLAEDPSERRGLREMLWERPEVPSNGCGTTLRARVQL